LAPDGRPRLASSHDDVASTIADASRGVTGVGSRLLGGKATECDE